MRGIHRILKSVILANFQFVQNVDISREVRIAKVGVAASTNFGLW